MRVVMEVINMTTIPRFKIVWVEMVQAEVQRIKEDNQVQSPLPDYTGM